MLTCQNLTLTNNYKSIFANCSFTAFPGSLIIIQGPNGSGKTCLLKMITGIINLIPNKISWNKIDICEDIHAFNSNTSYIGHSNSLKPELSVLENLEFWAKLRGYKELLLPAVAYFQLEQIVNIEVGSLSAGWQRRVELAKLLVTNTNLWLLDEPEINLDKQAKDLLLNLIKVKIQERGIVLIASHNFKDLPFANYLNLQDFKDEKMAIDC